MPKGSTLVDVPIYYHDYDHHGEDDDHVATELTLVDLLDDRLFLGSHVWIPNQDVQAHQNLH